jgi:hypothetical protein
VYCKIARLDEHIGPRPSHEFLFGYELAMTFDQRDKDLERTTAKAQRLIAFSSSGCTGIERNVTNEKVRANSPLIRPGVIIKQPFRFAAASDCSFDRTTRNREVTLDAAQNLTKKSVGSRLN